MDWVNAALLLVAVPLAAWLWWVQRRSVHPMPTFRRRLLLATRTAAVLLVLLSLANPAFERSTGRRAVVMVLDQSASQGVSGVEAGLEIAGELLAAQEDDVVVGFVAAGGTPAVLRSPSASRAPIPAESAEDDGWGADTDLAAAVRLACGLFPPGHERRLVLLSDGMQTRGRLTDAARAAAAAGVTIDAFPVAGEVRPDVRVVQLRPSRTRSHEGATIELKALLQTSAACTAQVRLFENGIEVAARQAELTAAEDASLAFERTPAEAGLHRYRLLVETAAPDVIPENNEALAFVDVRGKPLFLYVEGEPGEAHYLADSMAREGLRLHVRPPEAIPQDIQALAGYDGLILSDVPAHKLSGTQMELIHDYVEQLGGGFIMVGGSKSFGVGGYYRTPIEDVLPVKMKSPDTEEQHATALALVIDRSGSMSGQKIQLCRSAAIATVELLSRKDYIGVVAFDSRAHWVVSLRRVDSPSAISRQIATINAGGGTNVYPGMFTAYNAMLQTKAKVKHMIVLSDGHTAGSDYLALAGRIKSAGITVSTVAVGAGADAGLLQGIAAAGGGEYYHTFDPASIPRIFTQDTMAHSGKLLREDPFKPVQAERHAMLKGWDAAAAPPLMGYVRTRPKATAQIPLVTDLNDPLLAHWRFGLGKVTAFTSDCKSRWASLWLAGWQEGYSQFWGQLLREAARLPQGQLMDLHIEERGRGLDLCVDLLEDAAHFRNEADVEADVYLVPQHSLGSSMRHLANLQLEQSGPGRYTTTFTPDEPGIYLVRARSGANMVSAGAVHNLSGESAAGKVNHKLLETACGLTGGRVLDSKTRELSRSRPQTAALVELDRLILKLFVLLFLLDVIIRRWDHLRPRRPNSG